jgi:feruloyl esterase
MADGMAGYRRFGRGGAATSDWNVFLFGTNFEKHDAIDYMLADETAKVVEKNPRATPLNYNLVDYQQAFRRLSTELDLTQPNLSPFAERGGKLLVWYGLADTCVSLYSWADTVDRIKSAMGADKARKFMRFLTSPAVGHAQDGPGAGRADLIGAMDAWVEKGTPPDHLAASHFDKGATQPTFQRPLCEYPLFPRYKGTGDSTQAGNFACSAS